MNQMLAVLTLVTVLFSSVAEVAADKVVVVPLGTSSAKGTDGQLQYNNNGTTAGADLYYDDSSPSSLTVKGKLAISASDDTGLLFSEGPSDSEVFFIDISGPTGSNRVAIIDREEIEFRHDIWITHDLIVGNPGWSLNTVNVYGTLDVYGYAKLRSYDSAPVTCTEIMRGTIVMNNDYELCVCRPTTLGSAFKLARDPNLNCW